MRLLPSASSGNASSKICACLLLLAPLLLSPLPCSGAASATAPAPDVYSQSDVIAGLLRFADSIPSFNSTAGAARRFAGWTAGNVELCRWSYVNCSASGLMLNLGSVQLQGTLQSAWGQDLAAFSQIDLSRTGMQGPLPAAWARSMPNLVVLDLSMNANLTGSIPAEWGAPDAFASLQSLNLGSCDLQGTLPDLAESAMPYLLSLNISNFEPSSTVSGLTGSLPASWGPTRQSLETLTLRGNQINSTMPAEWGQSDAFANLQYLDLSYNQLQGSLPAWGTTGGAPVLEFLWIGHNNLSTPLPSWLTNLTSLQVLGASESGFVGTLPPSYGKAGNLSLLFLNNNALTGTLPEAWGAPGSFPSLSWFLLNNNSFYGTIPQWGFNNSMSLVGTLSLQDNRLVGSVPDWGPRGKGMTSLQQLTIDTGGGLCGTLPSGINLADQYTDSGLSTDSLPPCSGPAPAPAPGSATSPASINGLQTSSSSQSSGLSSGGIAGVVVGVVAALVLAALLAAFLWRRQRSQKHTSDAEQKGAPQVESSLLSRSDRTRSGHISGPLEIFLSQSATSSPGLSSCSTSSAQRSEQSTSQAPASAGQSGESSHRQGSPAGNLLSCAEMAALQLDWKVEPHRIQISRHPNGDYWLLGSGGFGMVYRGKMDGVNDVAVKLMKVDTPHQTSNLSKFLAEIDVLRACRDQHIVAFNGAWANEEICYYVCEYCHNGDLYTALADERVYDSLSWYQRGKSIALQVAKGLFYLHSNGIIHLDVKSPNILLTKQWQAKVADVGLARILQSKTHLSRTAPGGTYAWQAPETILGYNSSYSADIFSYGVVLLEIITGVRPVRGHYQNPLVPEQCPQAIRELVVQCMQSEPYRRPTAKEIITIIQELHPDA